MKMAHLQQLKFVSLVKEFFVHDSGSELKVLEIGSYDVNGSIRQFFTGADYVGVDLCEGPGVDLVSYGHEVSLPDATFDITISCECFEHDPNWIKTMNNMYRMTKPGGLVVISCATLGRLEHGTQRTASEFSPGTQFIGLDYYKNLAQTDFEAALDIKAMFAAHLFFTMPTSFDLYFVGWKNGNTRFNGDLNAFSKAVEKIRKIKRFRFKLYDVPVNTARSFLDEGRFQEFSCKYYSAIKPFRRFVKSLTHRKTG